ncbi:Protein of unknown function [Cotesia congregata]|uniref:Uncharacterized protein n=1 Tax=Cotesia congregata TaxID=51543 RepID=A0A8J2H0G5_COTCN|nr:Protein of unknown function [Cotesia congregata]
MVTENKEPEKRINKSIGYRKVPNRIHDRMIDNSLAHNFIVPDDENLKKKVLVKTKIFNRLLRLNNYSYNSQEKVDESLLSGHNQNEDDIDIEDDKSLFLVNGHDKVDDINVQGGHKIDDQVDETSGLGHSQHKIDESSKPGHKVEVHDDESSLSGESQAQVDESLGAAHDSHDKIDDQVDESSRPGLEIDKSSRSGHKINDQVDETSGPGHSQDIFDEFLESDHSEGKFDDQVDESSGPGHKIEVLDDESSLSDHSQLVIDDQVDESSGPGHKIEVYDDELSLSGHSEAQVDESSEPGHNQHKLDKSSRPGHKVEVHDNESSLSEGQDHEKQSLTAKSDGESESDDQDRISEINQDLIEENSLDSDGRLEIISKSGSEADIASQNYNSPIKTQARVSGNDIIVDHPSDKSEFQDLDDDFIEENSSESDGEKLCISRSESEHDANSQDGKNNKVMVEDDDLDSDSPRLFLSRSESEVESNDGTSGKLETEDDVDFVGGQSLIKSKEDTVQKTDKSVILSFPDLDKDDNDFETTEHLIKSELEINDEEIQSSYKSPTSDDDDDSQIETDDDSISKLSSSLMDENLVKKIPENNKIHSEPGPKVINDNSRSPVIDHDNSSCQSSQGRSKCQLKITSNQVVVSKYTIIKDRPKPQPESPAASRNSSDDDDEEQQVVKKSKLARAVSPERRPKKQASKENEQDDEYDSEEELIKYMKRKRSMVKTKKKFGGKSLTSPTIEDSLKFVRKKMLPFSDYYQSTENEQGNASMVDDYDSSDYSESDYVLDKDAEASYIHYNDIDQYAESKNLQDLYLETTFAYEDLSEDDEIFMMEVPKSIIEKGNLEGQQMKLKKKYLEIGDTRYNINRVEDNEINLVLKDNHYDDSYRIENIQPIKSIIIHEPKSSAPDDDDEIDDSEEPKISFPKNLKTRNPLELNKHPIKVTSKRKIDLKNNSLKLKKKKLIS